MQLVMILPAGERLHWTVVQYLSVDAVHYFFAGLASIRRIVKSREVRMNHWLTSLVAILALSFIMAGSHVAFSAPAKCNAELRKCNSHCNLVYESKRSNRVCRDRCKDTFYVCKARPS